MRPSIVKRIASQHWLIPRLALATTCVLWTRLALAEDSSDAQVAPHAGDLTSGDFEKLFQELQPPEDEPWQTIPWHISILEAAAQAERENKPVFMWQADGWPLGCG